MAPASDGSVFQPATAASHAAPFGADGRPFRYSKVVSSGATRPARAPASIDMLQIVIRPSIESAHTAEPAYSMTWPVPPAVPIPPMLARNRSLPVPPNGSSPSTVIRLFFPGPWVTAWGARRDAP